jgi:uncharacterized metal-binding protein
MTPFLLLLLLQGALLVCSMTVLDPIEHSALLSIYTDLSANRIKKKKKKKKKKQQQQQQQKQQLH